jgi:outer membrane protein assembly factor BamE
MPIKKFISALFLTFSLSGCSYLYDTFVYQIDVTQGNYIDDEEIARLETGMTQEQVIFILGSPMLIDQFDSSKWYYIRYIKPGGEPVQQEQVLLVFENRMLIEIQKDAGISENPLVNQELKNAPNAASESSSEDGIAPSKTSSPVIN